MEPSYNLKFTFNQNQKTRFGIFPVLELIIVAMIVAISAYLRFTHLNSNPGWYSDEGTWAIFTAKLSEGQNTYLGITNSNILFAKLPLFSYLGALLASLTKNGIPAIRHLSAGLGTINTLLIFIVVRFSGLKNSKYLAALSSLLYATFIDAILYSRIGFSYNLLATFTLFNYCGLLYFLRTNKTKWLILCALALSLGLLNELMGAIFLPAVIIFILLRQWKKLFWFIPLVLLPFLIYLISSYLKSPASFIFDIEYTFFRIAEFPLAESITLTWIDFYIFLSHNFWILPGIAGLFLIRPIRWRFSVLFFVFIPLLLLFRTVTLSDLAVNYLIPFWPFICIGLANFIFLATNYIIHTINELFLYFDERWKKRGRLKNNVIKWGRPFAIILTVTYFIVIPQVVNLANLIYQVNTRFPQTFMGALVNSDDAKRVANIVNNKVSSDSLVIASPVLASLINCNVADFQTSLAYQGVETVHLPNNIPHNRYQYPSSFNDATYIIIDPIWTNWAIREMPELKNIYDKVRKWPIEFQINEITVFRNPQH